MTSKIMKPVNGCYFVVLYVHQQGKAYDLAQV